MKVALLQYPIVWAEVQENLRLTELRLAAIAGQADVALLPEMFTTGFCTDNPALAEEMDGPTVANLKRWAREFDLAIAGSFMCREKNKLVNRGFFIRPDGTSDFIDKRHLYAHGGEADFFEAGKERKISIYKGVRFCLQICYDLRFPVWQRNKTGFDYDILLYCAAWPEIRIAAWDILVAARAIENQCYIAAVNCVGDDGLNLHYNGHSVAYDTRLKRLAAFSDNEESTRIADFDMDKLAHYREILPLWKDTDDFSVNS